VTLGVCVLDEPPVDGVADLANGNRSITRAVIHPSVLSAAEIRHLWLAFLPSVALEIRAFDDIADDRLLQISIPTTQ
jgi:hypothetical protein